MTTRDPQSPLNASGTTWTHARWDATGLTPQTLDLSNGVFSRYSSVRRVVLFGSRAKGPARSESDVDLALEGEISSDEAVRIAIDLDDLPLSPGTALPWAAGRPML